MGIKLKIVGIILLICSILLLVFTYMLANSDHTIIAFISALFAFFFMFGASSCLFPSLADPNASSKQKNVLVAIFITILALCIGSCTFGIVNREDSGSGSHNSSDKYDSTFTNKYGTPTTKCVQSGCNSYIASSGDTNCCIAHSNNCLECDKYIDGDAMYCMDCITKSLD